MMIYVQYLLFGAPFGFISILLFFLGITLSVRYLGLRRVKAPLKPPSFLPSFLCMSVGIVGVIVVLGMSHAPINSDQYDSIVDEAKEFTAARELVAEHLDQHEDITRLEAFKLEMEINRIKHQSRQEMIRDWRKKS